MGSPDGNGSSTGEGRNGALLLLRGGRPKHDNSTSERASALPSSNALRPDSNLNLGWYRPAASDTSRESGERDESTIHDEPSRPDARQSMVTVATARLDLTVNQAPCDPSDSPLGARRRRDEPVSSEDGRRLENGRVRVGLAGWCRLVAVGLGPRARELRKRPPVVGVAAGLLVLVALAAVTALDQPGSPHRGSAHIGSALEASQLQRQFLSKVASSLGALGRSDLSATVGTPVQHRSRNDAQRRSEIARVRGRQSNHTRAARISRSSAHSTPVSHAATSQSVSQGASSASSDSGTTAAPEAPAQTTPAQQTPVQQTSTHQSVHYQPPAQPVGPAGLGSQVGGNCNPKCS